MYIFFDGRCPPVFYMSRVVKDWLKGYFLSVYISFLYGSGMRHDFPMGCLICGINLSFS